MSDVLKDIEFCGYVAKPGTKVQGYISITDDTPDVPFSIINGANPGKRILITAGIHGNEYPGILATAQLVRRIDPLKMSGSLTILHLVNGGAFMERKAAIVPADGKNINRVYPGKENGTAAERIAWFITQEMGRGYDFYMDLHSGDLHEDLIPHLYYSVLAKPEVVEKSRKAAENLYIHWMVSSKSPNGSLAAASLNDLPGILIERGGNCIWNENEEIGYLADMYRLMKYFGMYDDGKERRKLDHIHDFGNSRPIVAKESGLWKPLVQPGDVLQKGQIVGTITDVFGNIREEVVANESATNLYQLSALSVRKGDAVMFCAVEQNCHVLHDTEDAVHADDNHHELIE